jgi:hypothetical protein
MAKGVEHKKHNGGIAGVAERLKRNVMAKVGIMGEQAKAEHNGLTNAELGAIHEFGAPAAGIPARSFLRASLRSRLDELKPVQESVAKAVVHGSMDAERGAGLIGAKGAAVVKRYIADGQVQPPDSPETVTRKGSSQPLVDTGQLLGSISWEVQK